MSIVVIVASSSCRRQKNNQPLEKPPVFLAVFDYAVEARLNGGGGGASY